MGVQTDAVFSVGVGVQADAVLQDGIGAQPEPSFPDHDGVDVDTQPRDGAATGLGPQLLGSASAEAIFEQPPETRVRGHAARREIL